MLASEPGFEVVGEAHSGVEVLPLVGRLRPDVVMLDMRMPGIDGLGCLDRLGAAYPHVKVVILSMFDDPRQIQSAFQHGAYGYVLKTIHPRDLASAIRQAVDGTGYHASGLPAFAGEGPVRTLPRGLSEQELDILLAVARGDSNKVISQMLLMSEPTVKFHLTRIYRKLGVFNRTQAARWAHEQHLVTEPIST